MKKKPSEFPPHVLLQKGEILPKPHIPSNQFKQTLEVCQDFEPEERERAIAYFTDNAVIADEDEEQVGDQTASGIKSAVEKQTQSEYVVCSLLRQMEIAQMTETKTHMKLTQMPSKTNVLKVVQCDVSFDEEHPPLAVDDPVMVSRKVSNKQLSDELKRHGQSGTGNKTELVERLNAHYLFCHDDFCL